MTEQELHKILIEHFVQTAQPSDSTEPMHEDDEFAFVVLGFSKPHDPVAFASAGKGRPLQRGEADAALGVAMLQLCPQLEVDDDDVFTAESIMRAGVHALASSVVAKFLSEVALNQVIGQVQQVMRKRGETLDA